MARSQQAYLGDIVSECWKARAFCKDCTWEQFAANEEKQYAVQHSLSIIGEAVSHLDPANRQALISVPLRLIRGLRNRLQHEYWDVDPEILWNVVNHELSPLVQAVSALLPEA